MNLPLPAFAARLEFWIVVAAVLAHGIGLGGTFLYDDLHAVADNPALDSLANVPTFFHDPAAFSSTAGRMYRPLVLTTLALSHALGGGAFWAFALGDVLLHALVAVLGFRMALRLGVARPAAGLAALWFAVHPLNVEAVRFASSRSDQLLALAVLLAVHVEAGAAAARRRWTPVLGVALATAIGCGAKETAALLPGVVAATALAWPRGAGPLPALRRALPRIGASLAVVVGYLALRKVLLGVATVAAPRLATSVDVHTGHGRDLLTQLCTMGEILPRLVAQTLLPVGLSLDPAVRYVADPTAPSVLAGWLAILGLTALGLAQWRARPAVFVGTVIAWAVALPWVLIPLNAPLGEHRFYGSAAGLALVLGGVLPAALPQRTPSPRPTARNIVAAVALAALGLAAVHRGHVLNDPVRAWQSALVGNPESAAAHCCLAQVAEDEARAAQAVGDAATEERALRGALAHAERAVALRPRHKPARRGVIRYHLWLAERSPAPLQAVAHAAELVEQAPRNPFARLDLANALALAAGRLDRPEWFDAAEAAALVCLEIAEPKGLVYRVASDVRAKEAVWSAGCGDAERSATARRRAVELLDASIARGLDHHEVRFDRAIRLFEAGRDAEARDDLLRVLAAEPFHPAARHLLQHGLRPTPATPGR